MDKIFEFFEVVFLLCDQEGIYIIKQTYKLSVKKVTLTVNLLGYKSAMYINNYNNFQSPQTLVYSKSINGVLLLSSSTTTCMNYFKITQRTKKKIRNYL